MGQQFKQQERSKLSRKEWREIDKVFRNEEENDLDNEEAFNIQEFGTLQYFIQDQIRLSYNG